MLVSNTPVEGHLSTYGLLVKREDLSCPPPGPPFSKMRGVLAHVKSRPESLIGVLDTRHSQAGHAVAYACSLLGKRCVNFYPKLKALPGPHEAQQRAAKLGAELVPLKGGRSAVLYHGAREAMRARGEAFWLLPNALKLPEMVKETEAEALLTLKIWHTDTIIVPSSSATIASGVLKHLIVSGWTGNFLIHLGYSRPKGAVEGYVCNNVGENSFAQIAERYNIQVGIVDEGYAYSDTARRNIIPPWPCNKYYDLKAFSWWLNEGRRVYGEALLWNVG